MLCDVYELCCWPVLPDWSFSSSDPVLYYFLLLSTHSAWLNFTSCSWPYATSLIHSFVASCIDYCDTVLAGAPKVTSNKLQWVLNAAARVVSGTHKFDWGLSRFLHIELHWLDIPERVVYKLGIMVFNCLHGQIPLYLVELCQPITGVASRQHLPTAPARTTPPTQLLWPFAFCVAGPLVWNSLLDSLRDPVIGGNCFRQSLKTFLFAMYWCIQHIRGFMTIRSAQTLPVFCNRLKTYLFSKCFPT